MMDNDNLKYDMMLKIKLEAEKNYRENSNVSVYKHIGN